MEFTSGHKIIPRIEGIIGTIGFALILISSTANSQAQSTEPMKAEINQFDTITLGAGCFWCVEAVFESIPGVQHAVSGYSGGHIKNPAYREVCAGTTGHAEVIQVTYDPKKLSLELLLDVFFASHDPTTLNRQGADAGTQYRSAIYHHTPQQFEAAKSALARAQDDWPAPIVTELNKFEVFYQAGDVHQEYYKLNKEAPYCRAVIAPKMEKFKKDFGANFH
jgi:peptide-methionine (S)-S-oxide reductase